MAKKSAKSKGYRRQVAKKPYLSKRDITILCAIVAVLAVAAFFLFRYDDGALKVQDGAVVTEGDNWLIANGSNVRGGVRYYKLGEIGQIDGYSREKGALVTDANIPEYRFAPDGGEGGDVSLTVSCGHGSAEAMAKYTHSLLENAKTVTAGEVQAGQLGGRDARWYSYDTDHTDAEPTPENALGDKADAAGEDKSGASADDKAGASADDKAGASTDDKAGASADDKADASGEGKAGASAEGKADASADDKSGASGEDKSDAAADDKADAAADDKADASADDKADASGEDKAGAAAEDKADAGNDKADASADDKAGAAGEDKSDASADDKADAGNSAYSRTLAGYIDASHDCCIIFSAVSRGDAEADCLDQDALQALVEKAVGAVTLEESK